MLGQILEREVVAAGVAPAACASVSYRGPGGAWVREDFCAGTRRWGARTPVGPDDPFDIASVSKPFLAVTVARLVTQRRLSLASPLGRWLPVARGTASETIPLELLLAHRAGLEAHLPLFTPLMVGRPIERDEMLRLAANARRPVCAGSPPGAGFPPVYSDLGYLLLGAAVEWATNKALDQVIEEEVSKPLKLRAGSARQWMARTPSFLRQVVPTEVVEWRGGLVSGMTHDENAWCMAGHGAAGHAGLFATSADVADLGAAVLDALSGSSLWLGRSEAEVLVRPRPGGSLRAGFDGKSAGPSAAGQLCSSETFGHLGFTGTSLWCDPTRKVVTVLLTNRVYPTREHWKIREARPVVQDALVSYASTPKDPPAAR